MGKRDIALRIKSVKETRKITRAMYLISASKFQKAKVMLDNVRPYYHKVQLTMKDILLHTGEVTSHYLERKEDDKGNKKKSVIVVTGDKGLCGAYNHNVIKTTQELIGKEEVNLMVIGEVGRRYFIKKGYNVDIEFLYTAQNPTTAIAGEISDVILNAYNRGLTDEISIVYTEMQGLVQKVRVLRLLPLDIDNFMALANEGEEAEKNEVVIDSDMIYEPSASEVFDVLVPEYLKGLIYSILVQAFASEHFARMIAMDGATSNADKMINRLTLEYNKLRQASITQEISEIVAGASV
ncbi:F-type H+-transporting ATPase subunit gamma [Thermoanaerobacter thermohydrosulfuricus]|uniref:ATP synthase gamma chain n=1 Tax=Thermoanaerobacter thermohydrosulfuricus TaxID=1516 RepID=A0A1G7MK07_THETY|nr:MULTISPECIES: ATP synthase F1 subunit gamma [Thermoanaerobacter]SDF62047.1 F-type H+-transporting ATPase subunit gamma [Thermoanaerobacter thermohydrosulfuricus]SFE58089.1 F-type H+-transporting ATPase subunit gamma [Thermoanaerobacter thermohydrosulfuricus]HHY79860.1 F0F1 ATP synthase subunit gamma [Thermoanaerobacter sp.]